MGGERGGSDIRQELADSLSRFGVAGDVTVEPGRATLFGSGPTVSVDIGSLVEDWPGYSAALQKRRINEVARHLAAERKALVGSSPPPADGFDWTRVVTITAVVVVAFAALIGYRRWVNSRPASDAPVPLISDYDAYERDRVERAARVCEATRSRVMRGATVGPSDVEGWVVELWALRSPSKASLVDDPALAAFVLPAKGQEKGRVVWGAAPTLAAAEGPDTTAVLEEGDVDGASGLLFRGLRLTFRGRYVVPYFDDTGRNEYLRFARTLTDALGTDYAALYARCANGRSHHVGSWFRGPSPGGAVTALLYFMGVFAEHPDFHAGTLYPTGTATGTALDGAFAFQNLSTAASPLKKARTMTMIGAEGGMISGTDGTVSTISFPFRDGNRASRTSLEIARQLGIGDGR